MGAPERVNLTTLASLLRFIAKTAHAFAVAKLGGDAFSPLLLDLILNRSDHLNHLIGGPDHPEPEGDTNAFEMWLGVAEQDDEAFLMAWLRIFGLLGGPAYVAVVGTLSPDQLVATSEAMAV